MSAWKPEWNLDLLDILSNQTALRLDSLQSTRPVRSSANTPAEISELFDGIAYEKGAAVLRMVESWLGTEAFRKGVNAYIERFKYGNAAAEDFWSTLATSSGQPVDRVMASFVMSWAALIGFAGATWFGYRATEYWWFWALVLVMLALSVVASLLYRIRVARLTEDHMWLRGTGRRFYQALPSATT